MTSHLSSPSKNALTPIQAAALYGNTAEFIQLASSGHSVSESLPFAMLSRSTDIVQYLSTTPEYKQLAESLRSSQGSNLSTVNPANLSSSPPSIINDNYDSNSAILYKAKLTTSNGNRPSGNAQMRIRDSAGSDDYFEENHETDIFQDAEHSSTDSDEEMKDYDAIPDAETDLVEAPIVAHVELRMNVQNSLKQNAEFRKASTPTSPRTPASDVQKQESPRLDNNKSLTINVELPSPRSNNSNSSITSSSNPPSENSDNQFSSFASTLWSWISWIPSFTYSAVAPATSTPQSPNSLNPAVAPQTSPRDKLSMPANPIIPTPSAPPIGSMPSYPNLENHLDLKLGGIDQAINKVIPKETQMNSAELAKFEMLNNPRMKELVMICVKELMSQQPTSSIPPSGAPVSVGSSTSSPLSVSPDPTTPSPPVQPDNALQFTPPPPPPAGGPPPPAPPPPSSGSPGIPTAGTPRLTASQRKEQAKFQAANRKLAENRTKFAEFIQQCVKSFGVKTEMSHAELADMWLKYFDKAPHTATILMNNYSVLMLNIPHKSRTILNVLGFWEPHLWDILQERFGWSEDAMAKARKDKMFIICQREIRWSKDRVEEAVIKAERKKEANALLEFYTKQEAAAKLGEERKGVMSQLKDVLNQRLAQEQEQIPEEAVEGFEEEVVSEVNEDIDF